MSNTKVAVITGGASGMGLAVAQALAADGWKVYVLYLNQPPADRAAKSLPLARFIQADVTSWGSLAKAFAQVFRETGRVDFVFANAGVMPREDFLDLGAIGPLDMAPIDVNLRGAIKTCLLALRYFRLSPHGGQGAVLIVNASCAGLYPVEAFPAYSASKAGSIAFVRAVAKPMFQDHGIRAHALCPGPVRTSLLNDDQWDFFPEEHLVPMHFIVDVVVALMDDKPFVDCMRRKIDSQAKYGLAVEVTSRGFYVKSGHKFSDETMPLLSEVAKRICRMGGRSDGDGDLAS